MTVVRRVWMRAEGRARCFFRRKVLRELLVVRRCGRVGARTYLGAVEACSCCIGGLCCSDAVRDRHAAVL